MYSDSTSKHTRCGSSYLARKVLPVHLLRDSSPVNRRLAGLTTAMSAGGVRGMSQHELFQLVILM